MTSQTPLLRPVRSKPTLTKESVCVILLMVFLVRIKRKETIQEGDHLCIASTVERRTKRGPLFVRNAANSCSPLTRMSQLSLLIPLLFHHPMDLLLTQLLLLPHQRQFMLRPRRQVSPPQAK